MSGTGFEGGIRQIGEVQPGCIIVTHTDRLGTLVEFVLARVIPDDELVKLTLILLHDHLDLGYAGTMRDEDFSEDDECMILPQLLIPRTLCREYEDELAIRIEAVVQPPWSAILTR